MRKDDVMVLMFEDDLRGEGSLLQPRYQWRACVVRVLLSRPTTAHTHQLHRRAVIEMALCMFFTACTDCH